MKTVCDHKPDDNHEAIVVALNPGLVKQGYFWEQQTLNRLKDKRCLEAFGYKVYSQNDEDGIINEIFNRIGVTNKIFIEFGVQGGIESNTHYLLLKKWRGLWIEADSNHVEAINDAFASVIRTGQLTICHAFITKDNIDALISSNNISGSIDLLSIDVDGNDYHIFEAISIVDPRVIVIEYNAKLPPDCEWIMGQAAAFSTHFRGRAPVLKFDQT